METKLVDDHYIHIKSSAHKELKFVTLESSVMPSPFAPKSPTKRTLLDLGRVLVDPDCGSCKKESKFSPFAVFELASRKSM